MTTPEQTQKRRKVRAILASGLVLGVGAAVTLAAWNDSVWGSAEFGTGANSWNVLASFDGTGWDDFASDSDKGTFAFDLGAVAPENMAPGNTVYGAVGLRVDSSAFGADVTLRTEASTGELAEYLTVVVNEVSSFDACGTETGTGVFTGTAEVGAFTGSLNINPESTKYLCFAVTLDSDISASDLTTPGSGEAEVTWVFDAQSV